MDEIYTFNKLINIDIIIIDYFYMISSNLFYSLLMH